MPSRLGGDEPIDHPRLEFAWPSYTVNELPSTVNTLVRQLSHCFDS